MNQNFQVRMPQLIAAFTPLCTSAAILSPLASEQPGTERMVLIAVGLAMSLFGVVCMIWIGFKRYQLNFDGSMLSVSKTRLDATEIRSIRIRKTMVDVVTGSWKKRTSFAFDKTDAESGIAAVRAYALENGIVLQVK